MILGRHGFEWYFYHLWSWIKIHRIFRQAGIAEAGQRYDLCAVFW